jgi:C-terminal processing protease CtpA/Prc
VRDQRVKVIVDRDGREEVVWVEPAMLIEDYQYVENDPLANFGLVLDDRYDDQIVVWKVIPQSPAYYAGIRAGDVFTTFHGRPVTTRQDFVRIIGDLREGEVPVQVRRGERVRDFAVDVPRFEARSERRTAMRPNYDTTRAAQHQENREERREDRGQPGQVPVPGLQPRR